MNFLLAIDQGTTSSRAVVYDETLCVLSGSQREITQFYPAPGLVEHDAEEIWSSVYESVTEALRLAGIAPHQITCIGITNQRETAIVWERSSLKPLHRAIVWQDRRTADFLEQLRAQELGGEIHRRTGLVLDPYFSASKIRWLLREIPDGLRRAKQGELAAGTVDSWLVARLTNGAAHITDVTNASRTMLMGLQSLGWETDLLKLFQIPKQVLPQIVPSSGRLAVTDATLFGATIPITGILGDQQAALFGQQCVKPGQLKCTYGTGCFLLAQTGNKIVHSKRGLLSTVAWKLENAAAQYALEGSVFMSGATIQWLRDGLGIIQSAPEVNELAGKVTDSAGVVFVPAFTGLGAPVWDSAATGTILGMTRGTTAAHIARAALEGIAHQVADVVYAMERDTRQRIHVLRVDGGASASALLMQIQAGLLGVPVERPENIESTALGAAMAAGLGARVWPDVESLADVRKLERIFNPDLPALQRRAERQRWSRAVRRAKGWLEKRRDVG